MSPGIQACSGIWLRGICAHYWELLQHGNFGRKETDRDERRRSRMEQNREQGRRMKWQRRLFAQSEDKWRRLGFVSGVEEEDKRAALRGSIHHTSGGLIRTWGEGFEVWTSKRLHTHTSKSTWDWSRWDHCAGLAKCRTGAEGGKSSTPTAAVQTREEHNKARRQQECCLSQGFVGCVVYEDVILSQVQKVCQNKKRDIMSNQTSMLSVTSTKNIMFESAGEVRRN